VSYKLKFEAANNVVEYEALILGLEAEKTMQITELDEDLHESHMGFG
jgi:ribonuclease HI